MIQGTPHSLELRWSELLARAGLSGQILGSADPIVRSVIEDSRDVQPASCFVAMRGSKTNGHQFITSAIQSGACAIVCEQGAGCPELPSGVAGIALPSARGAAGRLGASLYGLDLLQRSGQFKVAGITGTNGKSTFCFLLRSILQSAGHPTALLGTIEYDLLSRKIEAELTTPGASTLMAYLAEAAGAGATHATMEVSSIALDQARCAGVNFSVGIFSNLTGDHLDYHGTMDNYLAAKKRLFDGLASHALAVTNADDPAGARMVADTRARVLRYRIGSRPSHGVSRGGNAAGMTLWADVHEYTARGTQFDLQLVCDGDVVECVTLNTPLVGRHNVQNCLAAAGAAIGFDVSLEQVAAGLHQISAVPGRLQRVMPQGAERTDVTVLVDYAHTDDALANVLSALKPLTRGRLSVLFGCGGDRDRTKRPRMARVASQYADRIVVTSDNPRTEDPQAIIRDIMPGFSGDVMGRVSVEPDRREAIRSAVASAEPGDVVLLAGKGHENYQIIGREKLPFDDAVIAGEILEHIIQEAVGMKPLMLEEVIEAMQGQCERSSAIGSISRVTIDSREVQSGDLFFAIKGERFDGHDYVSKAFECGALAAVVRKDYVAVDPATGTDVSEGLLIRVDDPILALGRLGRYYRRSVIGASMTIIGVTGSNGKTTTKFMIAHVLSGRWRGHASIKSFNNNIGVPLTLLSAESGESFLVCEIGMNAPGEIAELGHLVEPDIAVVTNVAEAHLERLGSIERIAEEKLSLLSYVQADGVGIVNVDRDVVRALLDQDERFRSVKRVSVGEWSDADIRLTEVRKVETSKVESRNENSTTEEPCWEFKINNRFVYRLTVPGRHNVLNALCAIGVARRMGMDHAEIAERLASFTLPKMRLECETIGEVRVINDAYNANPASMAAAIQVLSEMTTAGRRVMVVGDMRELGDATENMHRRCAEQISASRIDVVIAVGQHAASIATIVAQSSGNRIHSYSYATTAAAKREVVKHLELGDIVLLKGSRAMGLEALVDQIRLTPVNRSKRVSHAA